jgi:hypothetical protein
MKTNIHFASYLAHFCLEWEMFQTKVAEKIKIHVSCSIIFSSENRAVYVEKYGRPILATHDNIIGVHALFMLDN